MTHVAGKSFRVTGASQKMDRSKKGPPKVPHHEGALRDLWGTDLRWAKTRVLKTDTRVSKRAF